MTAFFPAELLDRILEKPDLDRILPDANGRSRALRDAQIRHLIYVWRHRLNLLDWDVRYNPDVPPSEDLAAEITFEDEDKAAVICIAADLPDADLESGVVHELLHLVLRGYTTQANRLLVHVDGDRSRVQLTEMLDDGEEQLIETLVRALGVKGRRVAQIGPEKALELWAPFAA